MAKKLFGALLALFAAVSQARSSSLPPETISGTFAVYASDNVNDTSGSSQNIAGTGSWSSSSIISAPDITVSTVSGSLRITNAPSPGIFITGSAGIGVTAPQYSRSGNALLDMTGAITYYVEVLGPPGYVPLNYSTQGGVSPLRNLPGTYNADIGATISDPVTFSVGAFAGPSSFNGNGTVYVGTNSPFTVSLDAELVLSLESSTLGGAAGLFDDGLYAYVDPVFTIGNVPNPQLYTLEFSDGVGDSPATPLPAALPLFATGLGALGLFGWRRKWRTQTVAA